MADRTCSIAGCERPSRKRGWCGTHYSRWHRNGSPDDAAQSWVVGQRGLCAVCDSVVPEGIGFRRYCSRSCAVMSRKGDRPKVGACALCATPISMLTRYEKSGRLRYSSLATCDSCRRPPHLVKHVPALVARDGAACSLCGSLVDLSLAYPDPMSRSVDHVVPRSRGGADDFSNYALSHLKCNVRKNNRPPTEGAILP